MKTLFSLLLLITGFAFPGCQAFPTIVYEARIIAEDVHDYLEMTDRPTEAERFKDVADALIDLEEALNDPDEPIDWMLWSERVRIVWIVAHPFVPEEHRLLAHLVARRMERLIERLENKANSS